MAIWRSTDVVDGKRYRLGLCQDTDRRRYFRLLPMEENLDDMQDIFHVTEVVLNELLKRRDLIAISEAVTLSDGRKYYVDAHGIWLTPEEDNQIFSGVGAKEFKWSTPFPPRFL